MSQEEDAAIYLVRRLLKHWRLPVAVQFTVPVAWLAGTGIQKMLLPVLKICVRKKKRFSDLRKEILSYQEIARPVTQVAVSSSPSQFGG